MTLLTKKEEMFGVVKLTHDIVEYDLKAGDSGTVVDIYKNGEGYEVEFVNLDGTTKALLTLEAKDILTKRETMV